MEIKSNFILVGQNAVIDKDNKLTVIGIFNSLKAKELPIVLPSICLVVNFDILNPNKEDKKIFLSFPLISPSGKNIFEETPPIEREVDISSKKQALGNILTLYNISFAEFGEYEFIFEVNREKVSSTKISVVKEE